jgi:hypothetical protein
MAGSRRCRLGWHHLVDFPDPNPEAGGLESLGYRACTRCAKEKDANVYLPSVAYSFDRYPGRRQG